MPDDYTFNEKGNFGFFPFLYLIIGLLGTYQRIIFDDGRFQVLVLELESSMKVHNQTTRYETNVIHTASSIDL